MSEYALQLFYLENMLLNFIDEGFNDLYRTEKINYYNERN